MEIDEKLQGTEETRAGIDAEDTAQESDKELSEESQDAAQQENEGTEECSADETVREKKLSKELSELKDKYTRLYAEFDNFRKRSDKEKSQMFELGSRDIIERLLPVVDNFERALSSVPEDTEDAFEKGVQGIYKQIQKLFSDIDVAAIEAVGQRFDPALHNAVMTDTEGDAEEDTITQDLQKGYTFRGAVVRHSMVKVKK